MDLSKLRYCSLPKKLPIGINAIYDNYFPVRDRMRFIKYFLNYKDNQIFSLVICHVL